jgi:hypothetical protein
MSFLTWRPDGRVTHLWGEKLERPVRVLNLDDIPTSTDVDPTIIVAKDHDGVDRPINPRDKLLPWATYAVIDENPHLDRDRQELYALGVAGTLARLPAQPLGLSSRFVKTQSTIDQGFHSKGFRTAPDIPVLNVFRRHEIEGYGPDLGVGLIPGDTMNYKVRTILRLIDRIHEEPPGKRRAVFWMDDELGPADGRLGSVLLDYAQHQGVHLEMPVIDSSIGAEPAHLEQLADLCRDRNLPVGPRYLFDPERLDLLPPGSQTFN